MPLFRPARSQRQEKGPATLEIRPSCDQHCSVRQPAGSPSRPYHSPCPLKRKYISFRYHCDTGCEDSQKGISTHCLPCAELLLWTSSLSDFCVACSLSGYCSEATDESVLRGFCFRSAERVLKLAR